MSRAGDKKPVGFATQLTAGGIAGAMEAVRPPPSFSRRRSVCRRGPRRFNVHPRSRSRPLPLWCSVAMLPAARHHQGSHAAVQVRTRPRGESSLPLWSLLLLVPSSTLFFPSPVVLAARLLHACPSFGTPEHVSEMQRTRASSSPRLPLGNEAEVERIAAPRERAWGRTHDCEGTM